MTYLWLITRFVTRLTRQVPLVEQELLTLPENLTYSPIFSGVRVTLSLSFMCKFCRSLFVLLSFFCQINCVVCHSLIYGFWLPLWYLQTLLNDLSIIWNITSISITKKMLYLWPMWSFVLQPTEAVNDDRFVKKINNRCTNS